MVLGLLPQGSTLPAGDWQRRHRVLLGLLWIHAAGLAVFAVLRGNTVAHSLLEGCLVGAFALAAVAGGRGRRFQAVAVSLGLMVASAVLVHLWDGRTEAHFHFFVMVYILALYEDWLPFGLSFGFVVIHHGVMGALNPSDVYYAADAIAHPWRWAIVHGVFILGAGIAAVASWRLNEGTRARLDHQAVHDGLTRLPNRLLFVDRLGVALARARRTDTVHAVLFIDLDHFKVVNDSLGHSAGDEVLLEVAARLDEVVRANDTVSRFGGDEFTVLAEDLVSESAALMLAARIAESLSRPARVQSRDIALSASIGIALTRGRESAEHLLRDADAAMYLAKERGRGRVEVFDGALREQVMARLEVENDLRLAIERGELVTHFQPKVRIDTGTIVGVEALVRWQHPERGLVPPNDFIALAEETGLIFALGEWVLRDACAQAARWSGLTPDGEPLTVSVNLSRRQLEQPDLVEVVERALADTGLEPVRLCLEITESAVMRDLDTSISTLRRLKELGLRLAIDDFGVGFSSLSQLKHLPPVDMLKIDKSFVDNIATSDDRAIVAAILSLAGALGLTTVAEGVEIPEQAAELSSLGCELAQGFLFARPQPPEALDAGFAAGLLGAGRD